jgi:hypothetical protein
MPELANLSLKNYDGEPLVDIFQIQEEHLESLTKSLTKFMEGLQKEKEKSNTVIDNLNVSTTEVTGGASSETPPENAEGDLGLPAMPEIEIPEDETTATATATPEANAAGETKEKAEEKKTEAEANLNGETKENKETKA